jgi:rhodanese-related sulfurtransferase
MRSMNRTMVFLFALVFLVGCDYYDQGSEKEQSVSPEGLLLELADDRRFADTDELSDWLINDDPSYLFVDVRSKEEFSQFALPRSVNVTLDNILEPENQSLIDCERYTLVFISNNDILAQQAWMLQRRMGCRGAKILRGGLNKWASDILDPEEPAETASTEAWDTYQLRKAARKYFIGSSTELEPEPYVPAVKVVPAAGTKKVEVAPKPKPKPIAPAAEEEEGC